MNSTDSHSYSAGLTLRRAALIAGLGYLLMPAGYAEFWIYPKLVIPHNIEQTVQNISLHPRLFVVAILCYLASFLIDIVIAWALYVLLAPVNRSVSLLTAWFRLMNVPIAIVATLNLFTVFRFITRPDYLTAFGSAQLHAQVKLLLDSFRSGWAIALIVFGIHLVLLGWLICCSSYIPKIIGILLVINGLGWITNGLQPYLFANAHLGYLFITYFGELIFMLWLLIRGWKISEPVASA